MGDSERQAGLSAEGIGRQDRENALIALQIALTWTMEPARWPAVGDLVERMRSALARGDIDGLRSVSATLVLASPDRATSAGDTPTIPVPDPIRERFSVLIHILDPRSPAGRKPSKPDLPSGFDR